MAAFKHFADGEQPSAGDTVFITNTVAVGWSNRFSLGIELQVERTTPTQGVLSNGDRFYLKNGRIIGGGGSSGFSRVVYPRSPENVRTATANAKAHEAAVLRNKLELRLRRLTESHIRDLSDQQIHDIVAILDAAVASEPTEHEAGQ